MFQGLEITKRIQKQLREKLWFILLNITGSEAYELANIG